MKVMVLLALVLSLTFTYVNSQTCSSKWIQGNTGAVSAAGLSCPVGQIATTENGKVVCVDYATTAKSALGSTCSTDSDCKFTWMTCQGSKCVVKQTRRQGDTCTVKQNCASSYWSLQNCVSGFCKAYDYVFLKKGDSCIGNNLIDDTANTIKICGSGLSCTAKDATSYVCYEVKTVGENEECSTKDDTNMFLTTCRSGLRCVFENSKNVCKSVTILKQGESCTDLGNSLKMCDYDLVCRKASASSSGVTCEKYADWDQYCDGDSACLMGGTLHGSLTTCASNVCKRKYEKKDGETCEKNIECFSGYCTGGKCTTVSSSCNTLNACPTYDGNSGCVCGGNNTAINTNGTCVASCQGYVTDLQACLWNNNYNEWSTLTPTISTLGYGQIIDTGATAFSKCKEEYANVYTCLKNHLSTAGIKNVGTLDATIVDLTATTTTVTPKYTRPILRSSAVSIVASMILMVAFFLIMF
ncbi:hypothetical protein ABK040_015229 [Willaertia magna]